MSIHGEQQVRGHASGEHLVQLFDDLDSLASAAAEFLFTAWLRGDHLLVVARPVRWTLIASALAARGCHVSEAIASGRLVVLDATTTLGMFMVNGEPNPERFAESVGGIVRRLEARGTGLTAYGEMVDILAEQGNYTGAEQLEALWNALGERCSFRLLCGYSAAHFGDERTSRHLENICRAHHHAIAGTSDVLGTWLLANRERAH